MAQPLSEFHKTLQNNYTTCSKSHCELSMQMNYECRNANCLKIVCKKPQYCWIPAILNVYSLHSEWHTAVIK